KDKTPQAMSLMTIENDKGGPNKDLPYDEYLALRPKFLQLLSFLKQTAKEGLFIINPGKDNCLFCRYEDLCRKAHGATLRRAKNSAGAKKLKEYHDVKTKRPGAKG
ncbi:MAG: hypothetical protein LBR90_03185, partial [Elusimicrobiota bacterium]|nr:hypothetical protein [Elusimicrobiota bacterium]